MNFFKTLLRPDREELEHKDKAEIAMAANILQIGEFQFLQLAYKEWHGRELPESKIDSLFAIYMLKGEVPFWARHYARQIIADAKLGKIDDRDPTYHRYDRNYQSRVPDGQFQFGVAVLSLIIFLGGSLMLAELSVGSPAGILPPYLDEKGLQKASDASHQWGRSDALAPDRGVRNSGGQP